MTALLDPAALMQLQMAQRKPEVRWLAGAAGLAAAVLCLQLSDRLCLPRCCMGRPECSLVVECEA